MKNIEIIITENLSAAWKKAVKNGKIKNEFPASDDVPDRWSKGEKIEFGIELDERGDFAYFAKNLSKARVIESSIIEDKIPNSNFIRQFNGYRALRPGGKIAGSKTPDISPNVIDCRFGCQKPQLPLNILIRDPLAQLQLKNWTWNAYYNASPFEVEGHFLWIPVLSNGASFSIPHYTQALTKDFLEDMLSLSESVSNQIVFFNSLHAGASVNHIHIQGVYHKAPMPIESAKAVEYNGSLILDNYPAQAICFNKNSNPEDVYSFISFLQNDNIPFNLVIFNERIAIIPRNKENEVVEEFKNQVLATMELSGKLILADKEVFDKINMETIKTAYNKTTLNAAEIIDRYIKMK